MTAYRAASHHMTLRVSAAPSRPASVALCGLVMALAAACTAHKTPTVERSAAAGSPVVLHDVAVPMRDGVVLRADVFRPAGSGPFPPISSSAPGRTACLRRSRAVILREGAIFGTAISDLRRSSGQPSGLSGGDFFEPEDVDPENLVVEITGI